MNISCAPIASISSRMICSIFRWTRQPSGRNVHNPEPVWRMKPPRTSSLCETASASPGASRSVGRKSLEARVATEGKSLVERDLRGLGHRERGGLRHLQPLWPPHAGGDPFVDLV